MYGISSAEPDRDTAWRYSIHVDEWDHHKVWVTWSRVAYNKVGLSYTLHR